MHIHKIHPGNAQLDLRLATYATACAAACVAAPKAQADIVYSGPVSISVPATTAGIYLNLVTGTATTTAGTGWDFNPWGSSNLNFFYNTGGGGLSQNGTSFTVLTLNDTVAPTSTFLGSSTSATSMAAFRAGETGGYLGIRFQNEATGAVDYGWVQLTTTSATGYPATITGYAYDNTGAAIRAGQTTAVPEPGTTTALGTLAVGALGMRAWRRRKLATT